MEDEEKELVPADYDATQILSEELICELLDIPDVVEKERTLIAFRDRAKVLGVLTNFNTLVRTYKKFLAKLEKEKELEEKERRKEEQDDLVTNFDYFGNGVEFKCGGWKADFSGISYVNMFFREVKACAHPIIPIRRMKNIETGEEQIEIAWFNDHKWQTKTFPRVTIATATKIVGLASYGISVNDVNKTDLVKFLSEIIDRNPDLIDLQKSTSKLGWHGDDFIPYDETIFFDGDVKFRTVFESIKEWGNEDIWFNHVKELRKTGKMEVKMMIASSLASVLVGKLGVLPFFVDLWGETEGGKSVSLMLAASVWANPDESQYIGDFKTTDVALETKADMLNNLPMLLDDTSKTSARIRDNFEGIVYDLCSGKGKSRSNKELGINRENRWKNCMITNGERPLSSYVQQGGAINRIIEIECSEKIYENPQETAEILKHNYGFLGRIFVDVVKGIPDEELRQMQMDFYTKLISSGTMQKQAMSLSVVLVADKIANEYIFKDGCTISINDAKELLVSHEDVSDNQRCYEYILGKIAMNNARFDSTTNIEKWGIIENGWAIMYYPAFVQLCASGEFGHKSFLSWAKRNGIIQTEADRMTKQKKIDGKNSRCIWLKLDNGIAVDDSGFMIVQDDEFIPFENPVTE